jgi:hypothetical protein
MGNSTRFASLASDHDALMHRTIFLLQRNTKAATLRRAPNPARLLLTPMM